MHDYGRTMADIADKLDPEVQVALGTLSGQYKRWPRGSPSHWKSARSSWLL